MLSLALCLLVSQVPPGPPPKGAPTAAETAKLFYLAGDLPRAIDWAQRGLKREPKTCKPLNRNLAEYAFLANHLDELTLAQAKQLLELDRKISPTVRGKLTEKAYQRYVVKPLELATSRANGDVPGATKLVNDVLAVEPKNAEALALKSKLKE